MNSKQLNDELTIVGLFLILLFALYTIYDHSHKLLEAQKAVIYIDKKLTKAEIKIEENQAYLEQTKSQLTNLSKDIDKLYYLDKVKKDIDRNLWPDKQ